MEVAGLVFAVLGALAGVAGAYFAWVAIRPPRRTPPVRPAVPSPADPSGVGGQGGSGETGESGGGVAGEGRGASDVYISHAAADAGWVEVLAGRLRQEGVRVACDVLLPGDPVAHSIERAIRDSAHGLLVYSPAAHGSAWLREEYQALLGRAVAGDGHRLIPIIVEDAELPLFAANRYHLDFRDVSAAEYDRLVALLVRAVRR